MEYWPKCEVVHGIPGNSDPAQQHADRIRAHVSDFETPIAGDARANPTRQSHLANQAPPG